MPALRADGPNAEQVEYWNQVSGPKWVALQPLLDAQLEPLGLDALEHAKPRLGERALDVGCGCGQTTLELGRRVGPQGAATGLDISSVMLERARERAAVEGLVWVSFLNADAQTEKLPFADRDLVFSRFGVMFFADPAAAFRNLAASLVPGGRLVVLCWQPLSANPWVAVPLAAIAPLVEVQAPPAPGAPGPFSFGDPERVRQILGDAGYQSIDIQPVERELILAGGGLEGSVDFMLEMGPIGSVLREANEETRRRAREAVRDSLLPFEREGEVHMKCATWIATARI